MLSLYDRLGGETVLQQFVNRLYAYMDESVDVAPVRKMHPGSLDHANDRLFKFLSGMLGGPALYMNEFGHPRLRQRHRHFSIGDEERDQWLRCAQYAADSLAIESTIRDELMSRLSEMGNHLRNQNEQSIAINDKLFTH